MAAWFVDSEYDGRTFLVTQAFFPDKSALEQLDCALNGYFDEEKFVAFSGTTSLLFMVGTHKWCAVKVIDATGNEAIRVHRLEGYSL